MKHGESRINLDLVNEYLTEGKNSITFLGFSEYEGLAPIKSWEFENEDMRDNVLKKLDNRTACADIDSDKKSSQTGSV